MSLELTPEQQVVFGELYSLPGAVARRLLRRRQFCQADLEDAIQDGMMALCAAIRSYDPASGKPIRRYALYKIQRHLIDVHRKQVGRDKKSRRYKFNTGTVSLERQQSGGKITRGCEKLLDKVADRSAQRESGLTDDREAIDHLLRCLTSQQARAVRLYFCLDMKVREVAEAIGKCESRAFQLINSAIGHIRICQRTDGDVSGISPNIRYGHRRSNRNVAIVRDDGSLASVRQYADETGSRPSRVCQMVNSGKLKTVSMENVSGQRVSNHRGDGLSGVDRDCGNPERKNLATAA